MPITEANSGYLKQQGVVRVHGSLIVKTCKYQQPRALRRAKKLDRVHRKSRNCLIGRGNCSKYQRLSSLAAVDGASLSFSVWCRLLQVHSPLGRCLVGWAAVTPFCYSGAGASRGGSGPASSQASAQLPTHNQGRTMPQKEIWILFHGNGCGQPMGQPQGAWWHTADSDHVDKLPQTGSVTAGRKGSLLMFNLTLTFPRVSLFPAVISLVELGKPLMIFSVHTTNSSPTWN